MKKISLFAFLCASLMSFNSVAGDECTDTCLKEYEECKTVSESPTAKKVCESDLSDCKAQCTE